MDLCVTTDYAVDIGCPEPSLREIADAGFTHIHWCHQWNTDFLYGQDEVEQIGVWIRGFGLRLLDLHASAGREKCWGSPREYERRAGVELVANRIAMTRRLGGDTIVLHAPAAHSLDSQLRSLEDIGGIARQNDVRIALENLSAADLSRADRLVGEFGPELLGVCYDSGHANRVTDGIRFLERHRDRVFAVHLHDNDGSDDQHRIPGDGTVPWAEVCSLLASAAYERCVSLEVSMKTYPERDSEAFLADTRAAGQRIAALLEESRSAGPREAST